MNIISSLLSNLNYGTILFLMLLESTVIPVPSEFVVTPAAYHAAGGALDVWLVILFATIGANSKWGKMCLLSQEKVEKSERYFDDHGIVATLTGRLIPGIRHLISIPAGLAKMNYWKFLLYTTIGAGVWHAILAALGWYLHAIVPEDQLNDKIVEYAEYIKLTIVALVILAIAYFIIKKIIKKK